MAKQLTSITLNKDILKSSIDTVGYTITGQEQAVFNLQIKDSSTPNKFYNFKTNTFTNTFTSENTLSDVKLVGKKYQGFISIPASSNGNVYKFLVFPNRHFDTDGDLLTATITQESDITVRFSTASDQGDSNFEGIGLFTARSTSFDNPVFTGSSNTVSNSTLTTSISLADGADSIALGYKCSFDKAKGGNFIADSLQPVESDFFITFTKKTNGTGSSATEVVLIPVMSLLNPPLSSAVLSIPGPCNLDPAEIPKRADTVTAVSVAAVIIDCVNAPILPEPSAGNTFNPCVKVKPTLFLIKSLP